MKVILSFIIFMSLLFQGELQASNRDASDQIWKDFRNIFPYSFQGIAAEKLSGNEYVIIASEPPPHVTPEDLETLLPNASYKKHTVGYKGWVMDAVAQLELTDIKYVELIQDLHKLYYDTTYKAHVIDIANSIEQKKETPQLDYEFFPGELEMWLNSGMTKGGYFFKSLTTAQSQAISDIDLDYVDVFHSSPYGMVGLWMPDNTELSCCRAQLRQFAVDSDLIIGAIRNQSGFILLARARQVSLEALPPLRAETILQLSQVRSNELMQTINPATLSSFVVGGDNNIERWELNILSPELDNTEFGMLLTIADVLLKSWSLNGLNAVYGFRDYPAPKSWAFKENLITLLNADSLIFNYDSEAAGYIAKTDNGHTLYGVNRTGVLPLAYLPDELIVDGTMPPKVQKAELDGFDWFAKQQDPYLVRVVQYTAILQAFRACREIGEDFASRKLLEKGPLMQSYRMIIESILKKITQLDKKQLMTLADNIADNPHNWKLFKLEALSYRPGISQESLNSRYQEFLTAFKPRLLFDLQKIQRSAKGFEAAWSQRLTNARYLTDEETQNILEFVRSGLPKSQWPHFQEKNLSLGEIETVRGLQSTFLSLSSALRLDNYLAAHQSKQSKYSWIHTPVLIYDLNKGILANSQGGHNLKTFTERITASPLMTRGKIERGSNGVWKVHTDDLSKVRFLGRGREPVLMASAPKPVSLATKFSLNESFHFWDSKFWRGHTRAVLSAREKTLVQDIFAQQPGVLAVIRRSDGTYLIDNGKFVTVKHTQRELIDSVQDLAGGRARYNVITAGFKPNEVDGLVYSLASRRAPPGKTGHFRINRGGRDPYLFKLIDEPFSPKKLDANSAKVSRFKPKAGSLYGEVVFQVKGLQGQQRNIKFFANAYNKIVKATYWTKKKISGWFKNSVQESQTAFELKQSLTEKLRNDLKETFPGHNFKDANIKIYIPSELSGEYITEKIMKVREELSS
ncbi:hypothetical protein [Thalassomonas sp. RHCl1]|uniref:hypothetical protein n=1 Tax=Thalassomonas sp. RHCl1 TaxID=2995320 RepID=UPI00248D2A96|nr:hypothetical protein [Thalassomonas sp. RHCl1]